MLPSLRHITFDCLDVELVGRFWADVLGYVDDPDDPKSVKNRIHLDLQPTILRDAEVERILGLGATVVDDRRARDGTGWVVLADPEGNEFCVERSAAERAG
jgi:predicted enzyme related to lactoylglutathione lyase